MNGVAFLNSLKRLFSFFSLCKAIAAINRAIFGGLEGNLAFRTAIGTNSVIKSFRAFGSGFARIPAGFASLRLILEALFRIKFLLAGSEHELVAAIFTDQFLVFVHCFFLSRGKNIFTPNGIEPFPLIISAPPQSF